MEILRFFHSLTLAASLAKRAKKDVNKMTTEKNYVWYVICNIFDELNIFNMENYKRVIYKAGKDIGLREDNRGAIFI